MKVREEQIARYTFLCAPNNTHTLRVLLAHSSGAGVSKNLDAARRRVRPLIIYYEGIACTSNTCMIFRTYIKAETSLTHRALHECATSQLSIYLFLCIILGVRGY
uniref:Uncharacterized protein n=1 Tax=Trichogramma kaykai TaxID=54128 RepID=A0ABD2X781_9HYME